MVEGKLRQIIKEEINKLLKEGMDVREIEKSLKPGQKFRSRYMLMSLSLNRNDVVEILSFLGKSQNIVNIKIHGLERSCALQEIVYLLFNGDIVPVGLPYLNQCPVMKLEKWDEDDKQVALDWTEEVGYFHYSDELRKFFNTYTPQKLRDLVFYYDQPPFKIDETRYIWTSRTFAPKFGNFHFPNCSTDFMF